MSPPSMSLVKGQPGNPSTPILARMFFLRVGAPSDNACRIPHRNLFMYIIGRRVQTIHDGHQNLNPRGCVIVTK